MEGFEEIKENLVKQVVELLSKNIRISDIEKKTLADNVDEWLDGICMFDYVIGDRDLNEDISNICYYKMKGSDNPIIQKILKEHIIRVKKQSIEQDFI